MERGAVSFALTRARHEGEPVHPLFSIGPTCKAYVTPCTGFETATPAEPVDCL